MLQSAFAGFVAQFNTADISRWNGFLKISEI